MRVGKIKSLLIYHSKNLRAFKAHRILKIKSLLVYHSKNPGAFKAHRIRKELMPVMRKANSKAWVTREIFIKWINDIFGLRVHTYLKENGLPMKTLLVLNNAPGHSPNLQDEILKKFKFI